MLGKVRIANAADTGVTTVSNHFIDAYLADANDAQIKTYLFLLRAMQSGHATTVSEIADAFNHTEREVRRALNYWEKKGLVRLEYDGRQLVQIGIEDLCSAVPPETAKENEESAEKERFAPQADKPPKKRRYSSAEIGRFMEDEALSMTLFAAEQYFGHSLSTAETQSILYVYEALHFPADLLDYLLQYTAENADGNYASYLEHTAIGWHRDGVKSLSDATAKRFRYDKRVYDIMRELGLANRPTQFESSYCSRWLKEYGFSMEVIHEACLRTVARTQTHRVEYADGILSRWHAQGIRTVNDIARLDTEEPSRAGKQERAAKPAAENGAEAQNRFNRFRTRHDYDFDDIERRFVGNR